VQSKIEKINQTAQNGNETLTKIYVVAHSIGIIFQAEVARWQVKVTGEEAVVFASCVSFSYCFFLRQQQRQVICITQTGV
jgi:hypothetical protein